MTSLKSCVIIFIRTRDVHSNGSYPTTCPYNIMGDLGRSIKMKKLLIVSLLTLMMTGCSNFSTNEQLPVPGDCDFTGPLEKGTVIEEDCIN